MNPSDLELIPTQVLIDEILSRHRFAIFAGVSHNDDHDWQSKGDVVEILGYWELIVRPDLVEAYRAPCPQCESGEGHGENEDGE